MGLPWKEGVPRVSEKVEVPEPVPTYKISCWGVPPPPTVQFSLQE